MTTNQNKQNENLRAGIPVILNKIHPRMKISSEAVDKLTNALVFLRDVLLYEIISSGNPEGIVDFVFQGEIKIHALFEGKKGRGNGVYKDIISLPSIPKSLSNPKLEKELIQQTNYISGVLEYIAAEWLEMSGICAQNMNKSEVDLECVQGAEEDEELAALTKKGIVDTYTKNSLLEMIEHLL